MSHCLCQLLEQGKKDWKPTYVHMYVVNFSIIAKAYMQTSFPATCYTISPPVHLSVTESDACIISRYITFV